MDVAAFVRGPRIIDLEREGRHADAQARSIHEAVRRTLDVEALWSATGVRLVQGPLGPHTVDVDLQLDIADGRGRTALFKVCNISQNLAMDFGGQAKENEWNGKSWERGLIVARLISLGASVHLKAPNDQGWTPLHAAVWDRAPSGIVAMLIAAGSDVEEVSKYGFFVLYTAAQRGRADTVRRLLAAGADPNRRLSFGTRRTALDGAADSQNAGAYAPLLRAGAALPDPSRRDAYLNKIAATPGGIRAYERDHRRRLTAVFTNKFPALPVEVISHIVLLWAHCGDYLS